jgi:hypothetical protein
MMIKRASVTVTPTSSPQLQPSEKQDEKPFNAVITDHSQEGPRRITRRMRGRMKVKSVVVVIVWDEETRDAGG